MSDIASPILAVMDNEAHAFICFCGIMKRLEGNFRPDGHLMSVKFQHLKLLLQYSDPEFYFYLVSRGADDLFFCYRWLLLELKREFAFDDALRMLEVTWSSLPQDPPETEVDLLGPPLEPDETMARRDKSKTIENRIEDYNARTEKQHRRYMLRPSRDESDVSGNAVIEDKIVPGKRSESFDSVVTPVTMEKAEMPTDPFERQSSFGEFKYYTAQNEGSFDMKDAEQPQCLVSASQSTTSIPRRQSTVDSEDDPEERTPRIKNYDCGLSPMPSDHLFSSGLPTWKTGPAVTPTSSPCPSSWPGASPDSSSKSPSLSITNVIFPRNVSKVLTSSVQVLSTTRSNSPTPPPVKTSVPSPSHTQNQSLLSSPILSFGGGPSLSGSRSSSNNLPSVGSNLPSISKNETTSIKPCSLPPPQEFGKGNPFMLFLCLSILLEHRDHIIKNSLDYNELAMHFDRLVRRHNLSRVLQRAKALFADYLQSEVWESEEGDEVSFDSPTAAQHSPSSTISARPIYSPLASPQSSSPYSTYNLSTTIPSPTTPVSISPSL